MTRLKKHFVFKVLQRLAPCLLLLPGIIVAQEAPYDIEDIEVSYIYAAIMGTGTYKIDERRITMLRAPFKWTQQEMTETEAGYVWHMPVVIGHDSVKGSDWFEELIPDELITVTVLPGFEYQMPVSPDWAIKPFGNIGYTHDFVSDEDVIMGVVGVSSLARFYLGEDKDWELRWGNKIRFAAEYQHKSESETSFGVLETGIDVRRGLGYKFAGREIDMGGYYRFQHFLPEWNVSETPDYHADIANVHEFGISIGLKRPRKIFGVTFSRVRAGYKIGDDIRGFSFGGEFPF
ncbi:MAG: hypothetical protein V7746_10370 [Halioglobus sp.]